jgi:hypothetical protein
MIRTFQDVPKKARNSITIQIEKLVKRYGDRPVRLVATKIFDEISEKRKLEEEIKQKETELQKLKSKK